MSKHVRETCKNCEFPEFKVPKGAYLLQKLIQIDNTRTRSVVQDNFNSICQSMYEERAETMYFQRIEFQKGHNSFKTFTQIEDTRNGSVVQYNKVTSKFPPQYVKG